MVETLIALFAMTELYQSPNFNPMTSIINYAANKFLPYLLLFIVLFSTISWEKWEPYVIVALIFFIDKFSFKTGYAVAFCEGKGIELDQ